MNKEITLWQGPKEIKISPNNDDVSDIMKYAESNLKPSQISQLISAYKSGAYEMASEYIWKKAITKLKESLSRLGIEFICELLQRPYASNEYLSLDALLTDYTCISLAEQLGMINHGAAMQLRQCYEQIQYAFSSNAQDEDYQINKIDSMKIIFCSVQYILSESNIQVATSFASFRDKLLDEDLSIDDAEIIQLKESSLFYLRTVCSVLTTSIRKGTGSSLVHSLSNFKLILPLIWGKLNGTDKWNIGTLYRDVVAAGNAKSSAGVKTALASVKGFDYVPESLRSNTFIDCAKNLISIHFGFDNFYREPNATNELAQLGTIIPDPALFTCIKAYVLVYIGNNYGRSIKAVPIAEKQLLKISEEQWEEFFDEILPEDTDILSQLTSQTTIDSMSNLIQDCKIENITLEHKDSINLFNNILNRNYASVKAYYYSKAV